MPTGLAGIGVEVRNMCLFSEHLSARVASPTSRCTDLGATVSQAHTSTSRVAGESNIDIASLVADLLSQSFEQADRESVNGALQAVRSVRTWLDALEIRVARRVRQLHDVGRADSPVTTLIDNNGCSGRDARNTLDREGLCADMPLFETALGGGRVGGAHLDAMARATSGLSADAKAAFAAHQQRLLALATQMSPDSFERRCRDLARSIRAQLDAAAEADRVARQRSASTVRQWTDRTTGMGHTHIELDPERHAALWTSIEAHLASVRQRDGNSGRPFAELQVEAVVELVSTGGSTSANRRLPEIEVLIDWSTLVDGVHPTTVCETVDGIPLPIQTVQRLCCEADVLPVVLRSSGEVLHAGRTARVATRAQRRALAALHRTCAHPHCQAAFSRCQIHHVIPWECGGRTDLDNLIPLCTEHHHLVHEGGWSLQLHKDRTITLNRPDGTRSFSGRTTDRLLVDSQRSH